jgi:hypothetical protein
MAHWDFSARMISAPPGRESNTMHINMESSIRSQEIRGSMAGATSRLSVAGSNIPYGEPRPSGTSVVKSHPRDPCECGDEPVTWDDRTPVVGCSPRVRG